ncbi:MAG: hypothetical protein M0008_02035 [Actinomycetota bacterium]|nr:hypothetical protein [Actinomycetota bacterium]
MDRSVLAGISVFRWLALAWMTTALFFDRHALVRPWLAYGLVIAAVAVTIWLTGTLRASPDALYHPVLVAIELSCGCALFVCGGLAFGHGAAFATSQALGVAWPLAGVLTAGAAGGAVYGVAAGSVVGVARFGGAMLNGIAVSRLVGPGDLVGTLTPIVLYAMAGCSVGYLVSLLRRAEFAVAAARAREEMARALHDGVLQTLAAVERQSMNPELSRMAREQERSLRALLASDATVNSSRGGRRVRRGEDAGDLAALLRSASGRFEQSYGGRVEVIAADGVPSLAPRLSQALAGAVGEALNNAGKHGGATRVTVYLEDGDDPASGGGRRWHRRAPVFCSVKDNGAGFDPHTTIEGMGITRSIRARITEVGGRVEVSATPGEGAEVRIWI